MARQQHKRLRAAHRAKWEKVRAQLVEDGTAVSARIADSMSRQPRSQRHGHRVDIDDFLPGTYGEKIRRRHRALLADPRTRHYPDGTCAGMRDVTREGYSPAELRRAHAGLLAWLATLAACGRPAPRDWGVPDDEPVPAEALELLTPLQPHAPPALALEEVAAA